jgi:hypothetical protein
MKMKYRIEIKPVRKFRPVFEADSLAEIQAWLANPTNTTWRYYGTGADYKKIQHGGRDLAVTEMVTRADMMDDNDNVLMAYTETPALRGLTVCAEGSELYAALK